MVVTTQLYIPAATCLSQRQLVAAILCVCCKYTVPYLLLPPHIHSSEMACTFSSMQSGLPVYSISAQCILFCAYNTA